MHKKNGYWTSGCGTVGLCVDFLRRWQICDGMLFIHVLNVNC